MIRRFRECLAELQRELQALCAVWRWNRAVHRMGMTQAEFGAWLGSEVMRGICDGLLDSSLSNVSGEVLPDEAC